MLEFFSILALLATWMDIRDNEPTDLVKIGEIFALLAIAWEFSALVK